MEQGGKEENESMYNVEGLGQKGTGAGRRSLAGFEGLRKSVKGFEGILEALKRFRRHIRDIKEVSRALKGCPMTIPLAEESSDLSLWISSVRFVLYLSFICLYNNFGFSLLEISKHFTKPFKDFTHL